METATNDALRTMGRVGLVSVIQINGADNAVPLAEALAEGGPPVAAITFRTAAAEDAIRRIAAQLPDMLSSLRGA